MARNKKQETVIENIVKTMETPVVEKKTRKKREAIPEAIPYIPKKRGVSQEDVPSASNVVSVNSENKESNKPLTMQSGDFDIRFGLLLKYKQKTGDLVIPEGVTETGYYAVANKYITSIVFPASLNIIGRGSFFHCEKVKKLSLHNVKEIGGVAFADCKNLSEIDFGNSLKIIGNKAFAGCKSLTHIQIPANVEQINAEAFADCVSLEEVRISKKTVFADNTFARCPDTMKIVTY